MTLSLPFSPLVSILPYPLMHTVALGWGKTLLQSIGLNATVKISPSRIMPITLVSVSEFIWGFKEVHLMVKIGVQAPLLHLAPVTKLLHCFASGRTTPQGSLATSTD